MHDIKYSTSICPFEPGKSGKEEGKIQKFEYLGNGKSFLDEIKSIFHSFWRAIILWKNKNLMKNSGHKLSAPWCSGYHYCTTSFNQAWTQVLRRFKFCSRRVGDSRWWGSPTVVPTGNKAKRLSSVNHTTKEFNSIQVQMVKSPRKSLGFFRREKCKRNKQTLVLRLPSIYCY